MPPHTLRHAGVKTGADGHSRVDVVLPLYLTAEHFGRALPALEKALAVLAPGSIPRGGNKASPEAWLEVRGRLLVLVYAGCWLLAGCSLLAAGCCLHDCYEVGGLVLVTRWGA
jgi:hypothetical protein